MPHDTVSVTHRVATMIQPYSMRFIALSLLDRNSGHLRAPLDLPRGEVIASTVMIESCIVALGGGGFSMEPDNPRLDRYILSLARRSPPKVCFVPTASGDSDNH